MFAGIRGVGWYASLFTPNMLLPEALGWLFGEKASLLGDCYSVSAVLLLQVSARMSFMCPLTVSADTFSWAATTLLEFPPRRPAEAPQFLDP